MDIVKLNVKNFLNYYSLENKHILAAFSGGYDSMCLLSVLNELKDEFSLTITAIHLNHGWRGKESDCEEENCRRFASQINVSFYSERLPDNIKHTETDARLARYEFFQRCAKKFKTNVVFTAHNYNDNAETVLYRIVKGTGIDGLSGISKQREIFYRPLLNVNREDIEAYCLAKNLIPNQDSSNKNTDFSRNHIRLNILPKFKTINPFFLDALNTLSQNARENTEIISEYLTTLKDKFQTQNFINFSPALKNRIIYEFLDSNNLETNRKTVLKLVKFINENSNSKNGKTISLNGKDFLFVNKSEIRLITHKHLSNRYNCQITSEGEYTLGNNKFVIEKTDEQPDIFPSDIEKTAYVDLSETGIDFTIRTRLDGDIIQPLGVNGKQKFKKYLNAKGVPRDLRHEIPLLCKGNEVFWAISLGISDKIKVRTSPTHKLTWY